MLCVDTNCPTTQLAVQRMYVRCMIMKQQNAFEKGVYSVWEAVIINPLVKSQRNWGTWLGVITIINNNNSISFSTIHYYIVPETTTTFYVFLQKNDR